MLLTKQFANTMHLTALSQPPPSTLVIAVASVTVMTTELPAVGAGTLAVQRPPGQESTPRMSAVIVCSPRKVMLVAALTLAASILKNSTR